MNLMIDSIPTDIFIENLLKNNGPDPDEYSAILELVDRIETRHIKEIRNAMQAVLNPGTIIGFSYTKPFGYNGDFFIIEKIYQHFVNPDPRYKKWDIFFHTLEAAVAVVNRKALAINILKELNAQHYEKEVLILGSGPVTEVYEYFHDCIENFLSFELLDLDKRAIAYAKNKHKANLHLLNFHNQNVIRHNPDKKYDLIWSAGLFDYFRDKHFVYLIKKYYAYLKEGGEMIIGNFNIENPSRKIMEILGDWFLYHRSEDSLVDFALRAGVPRNMVEVIKEPLGINLFLRLKK